jgi:hypothetical protein
LITLTIPGKEYKPCSSSLCSFLQPPVTNNELPAQQSQTDWNNKIKHTVKPNCGTRGIYPDLPYPRNGPSLALLTDTFQRPHVDVPWAATGPRAEGLSPLS